ncbi:(R)-mandelonitrile lyase [Sphingomonas sp. CFBP 13720]|uniref:(R)-mandelonitrile lyase n=1 Tax=Sphingomonas sp. CFBP 13720 TaxID=2775302 RepID=UPI0017804506|nr:cupin domain-containing protein [Sphingomonas sp. CFBP 13720]MBD8680088.1 cupin domain-containing protein [Sphingomonas sp. CFBP 13720]
MKCLHVIALLGCTASTAQAQTVVRAGEAPAKPGPATNFTGTVSVRTMAEVIAPGQAGAALVTFQPGARTNWHTHPAGQILYVTEGCGWIQEEGSPVIRVCEGVTIHARPGAKHWHGATSSQGMRHLAVTETIDGKPVDWLEPVPASQYHGPAR